MKRILLMGAGGFALLLGAVGLLLPVWPTTPFVICAAGCFGASSPKLYAKLAVMPYFGEYIRNYRQNTGISKPARWMGIGFLWLMLGISAICIKTLHLRLLLLLVGIAVSIHIFTIKRKM